MYRELAAAVLKNCNAEYMRTPCARFWLRVLDISPSAAYKHLLVKEHRAAAKYTPLSYCPICEPNGKKHEIQRLHSDGYTANEISNIVGTDRYYVSKVLGDAYRSLPSVQRGQSYTT
jgi:hypothetical protein